MRFCWGTVGTPLSVCKFISFKFTSVSCFWGTSGCDPLGPLPSSALGFPLPIISVYRGNMGESWCMCVHVWYACVTCVCNIQLITCTFIQSPCRSFFVHMKFYLLKAIICKQSGLICKYTALFKLLFTHNDSFITLPYSLRTIHTKMISIWYFCYKFMVCQ